MNIHRDLLLLLPLAYLLGSVPFGLLVGLSKGIDPRKSGSGNIGATNVGRLLGGKYFGIVFALDLLKGFVPMLAGAYLLRGGGATALDITLWLLIAAAALAGHVFSIFLHFKGGKGVATGAGVALGVYPYFTPSALIAAALFIVVFKRSRIVSLASIVAAGSLPISFVIVGLWMRWDLLGIHLPLLIFVIALPTLVIYRHRTNIARLRAGTENRFSRKST